MTTYLVSIPESIKKISDKLNIKATLCNRSWCVFNDQGIKMLYIFQNDGSLIISINGVVAKSKWEYIKANKTLLIEDDSQSLLFHPAFIDDTLFALQQDGTEKYLLMINEQKQEEFIQMTLEAVCKYFSYVENPNLRYQDQASERERKRTEREQTEIKEREERIKIIESSHEEIDQATRGFKKTKKNLFYAMLGCVILYLTFIILAGSISSDFIIICTAVLTAVLILLFTGYSEADDNIDTAIDKIVEDKRKIK